MAKRDDSWPQTNGPVGERLIEVLKDCGYSRIKEFADTMKDGKGRSFSDMRVTQWIKRESIHAKSMSEVVRVTGVSPNWLTFGLLPKYIDGPKKHVVQEQEDVFDVSPDLQGERDIVVLQFAIESLLRATIANVRGSADVYGAELRKMLDVAKYSKRRGLAGRTLRIADKVRDAEAEANAAELRRDSAARTTR